MRPNFMQSSWHYSAHVRAIRSKLSHHVCMALKNMVRAGGHLLISAGRAFHSCIINIRRAHSKCISPGRRKADRRIFAVCWNALGALSRSAPLLSSAYFPGERHSAVSSSTLRPAVWWLWHRPRERYAAPRTREGSCGGFETLCNPSSSFPSPRSRHATRRHAAASAAPQTQMVFSRHRSAAARQIFMWSAIWPGLCPHARWNRMPLRQKIVELASVMAQIKSNFLRMKNSMLHVAQWNPTT